MWRTGARLPTDDSKIHSDVGRRWQGGHEVSRHWRECVSGDTHTNTGEGFFGLFKRGIAGAWHHISEGHMQRHLDEFAFRWNARHMTDEERTLMALRQGDGVRLTYRPTQA